jgi:hypothetical protein
MRRLLAVGLMLGLGVVPVDAGPAGRPYSASMFALELDGGSPAFLRSAEGGGIKADVVEERDPFTPMLAKKHLGPPSYDDLVLALEPDALAPLADWLAALSAGKPIRKDAAVVLADADGRERRRVELEDCLLTEVTVPGLDVASPRDPASLTLRLAPELTRWKDGSGARLDVPKKGETRRWLPSNFRLALDGLECRRVRKVDAFTIRQHVEEDAVGANRPHAKEPTRLEIPNLRLTIDVADVKPWRDWHRSFVVEGRNGDGAELGGSLVFLAPDLRTELGAVEFEQVGILRLEELPPEVADPKEGPPTFVVVLYVERMRLRTSAG